MALLELDNTNFEAEVLKSSEPVLVDFWAPWCGPCRMIAPLVEELAGDNVGKAKIAKLNIDDASNLAEQYRVSSIPTLMVFKDGQPVETFVGPQPKAKLQRAIDAAQA